MRVLKALLALAIALQPLAIHAQDFDFEKKFLEQRAKQTFKRLRNLHNLIDFVSIRANEVDKAFLAKLKKNVSNRALPSIRRDGNAIYFSGHETPFLVGSARPLAIKYKGNSWVENPSASLEEMLTSAAKALLKDPRTSASLFSAFGNYAHAAEDDWARELEDFEKGRKDTDKKFEKAPALVAQGILATVLMLAGAAGLFFAEPVGKAVAGVSMIVGFAMFPKSANASDLGTANADGTESFEITRHECKKDRLVTHFKVPGGIAGTTETVVGSDGHPNNYSFYFAGDPKPKYKYFLDGSPDKSDWKIVGKSAGAPDQSRMLDGVNIKFQKVLWDLCKSNPGAIDAMNKGYLKLHGVFDSANTTTAPMPAADSPKQTK